MRPGPVLLLLTLSLSAAVQAEESPPQSLTAAGSAQAQAATLEQRPALVEEPSLNPEPQVDAGERESVQLQRLRQENQRLKLQLKKALAQAPQPLISEQQLWFAIGAAAGLLGVIVGALLRGNRRSRREWLN